MIALSCCCALCKVYFNAGTTEPVRLVRPWPDQIFGHKRVFTAEEVMCICILSVESAMYTLHIMIYTMPERPG